MATDERTSGASEAIRTVIGSVLFVVWLLLTVLWVSSIVHSLGEGNAAPLIKGICALLLMALLAGMEGLEVAVIDRWNALFPDRPASQLAGWLAARQLFVALIVTTATILVEPETVPLPGFLPWSEIPAGGFLKAFTIIWTTMTVLWFMQILPKHMAATNPDRYLARTRPALFPIVQVVHYLGFDKPASTTASFVERALDWHTTEGVETGAELESRVPTGMTPGSAWAALIPEGEPAPRRAHRDDRAADA